MRTYLGLHWTRHRTRLEHGGTLGRLALRTVEGTNAACGRRGNHEFTLRLRLPGGVPLLGGRGKVTNGDVVTPQICQNCQHSSGVLALETRERCGGRTEAGNEPSAISCGDFSTGRLGEPFLRLDDIVSGLAVVFLCFDESFALLCRSKS